MRKLKQHELARISTNESKNLKTTTKNSAKIVLKQAKQRKNKLKQHK